LYRIAQEAVSNAIKHGKASRITIQLSASAGRALLIVVDNGTGFSPPSSKHKGMGLRIMEYRAGMIGGALSISRDEAGGTTVQCSVPIRHTRLDSEKQRPE
jgi:two-component system sensor kinase FixL